jgi:MAP/microtubule affinity-regulating kinase
MNVDKLDAGSLFYMAPEVLNGSIKKVGASIDIWALGVILFGLVEGRLPFMGNTTEEILASIYKVFKY